MATKGVSFNPATDIPSLKGRVILITGANTGLGKQTALELAKHHPSQLWMAARNVEKGNAAMKQVQAQSAEACVKFLHLDLTSFDSIKRAVMKFLAETTRLDLLYLNAGILGCPPDLTADGYEIQMGTNHLGHALLLKLLIPRLLETASHPTHAGARVLSLSSTGYKSVGPEGIQFPTLRTADAGVAPIMRYCQSKLANLLYAREIAARYPQFTTVSIDPGEVATELFSREPGDEQVRYLVTEVAPLKTHPVEEGVRNQLWAGVAGGVRSGLHYEPVGVEGVWVGFADDREMRERLWAWTEDALDGQRI